MNLEFFREKLPNAGIRTLTELVPKLVAKLQPVKISLEEPMETSSSSPLQHQILIPTTHARLPYLATSVDNLYSVYGSEIVIHALIDKDSAAVDAFRKNYKKVHIHFDTDYYFSETLFRFPDNRRRWFYQQTLKILFVAAYQIPTLILDSDTFILKPIDFMAQEKINLCVRSDVHWPYQHSLRRFLKVRYLNLSFVTHFQLMSPSIIQAIFGDNIEDGVDKWLESSLFPKQSSPLSEYQTFGQYMFFRHPELIRLISYTYTEHDLRSSKDIVQTLRNHKGTYDVVTLAREDSNAEV